ncbi:hypothetical protein [Burkholderia sp. GbtcB21]|uniref:hypothetical protein n=1 Tax=Burkholderia sp. GbtcB21 TaxID=2824766 RepID=UPI001C302CB0|nr:hypothetical protein [Burkholderia sp. GbtcB21]
MGQEDTVRKLADMTDEGAFERLATAVLRCSDSQLHSLSHPGVNADGKTVKSPVDGITFVLGNDPPQMVAVHHTICAAKDLEKKWLHDPATVKARGRSKRPTAPAGDVVKTIEIIEEERKRTPNLRATLILTTNQEPSESLMRNVNAAGIAAGIAIDIWARSRLADILDNDARGQWLRRQFLGIEQVRLSEELLSELSKKNLDMSRPPDRPEAWVERNLDRAIEEANEEKIVFVIAESGAGKSVACYKRLWTNSQSGGFSFVLTDEAIASSLSLEQAVEKTLMQLHPSLMMGCGRVAFELTNPSQPLLLSVEDVSRSGRGATLIEKIARWNSVESREDNARSWQLLCPVWPQVISSLNDEARRRINNRAIVGTVFTADEGAKAVERRRELDGRLMTKLEATRISAGLGHDPLLIALHDPANSPDISQTIAQFVEANLQQLTATKGEFSASEYRKTLLDLAKSMLLNRQLEPGWLTLLARPELIEHATALRHLVHQGSVIRLAGPSTDEKLAFRHDRVREWLLAQAAFDLLHSNAMPDEIVGEPYFAELFGLAITRQDFSAGNIATIADRNPLALFCAVPHLSKPASPAPETIVAALEKWLNNHPAKMPRDSHLRWEAMRVLADAEGPSVLPLVSRFNDNSWSALRARYRNGDLMGGIGLCMQIEPGVIVAGHDAFLDHVRTRLGANLVRALATLLSKSQLEGPIRTGALRLAGHIGEPTLANAIRACWHNDEEPTQHLGEYLWACAQCVDTDPATLLGPVCDAWALLSNDSSGKGMPSPRDSLAAHNVRFAFHIRLPDGAVRYFIERAGTSELEWPITYMLHGLDHPDAVEFIVRKLAAISARLEGTVGFSPFVISAKDEWERRQKNGGRAMSVASRQRLLEIWQDQASSKHLREQAFRIWASTYRVGDLHILRAVVNTDNVLADKALWRRLQLGDREAIPELVSKLSTDRYGYWWQLGRYIWSSELTTALDKAFERRRVARTSTVDDDVEEENSDWILSEIVVSLPTREAEAVLSKHWDHLASSNYYVIAALYIATPGLQARVSDSLKIASDPKGLLKHFSMLFGQNRRGRSGLFRTEQIEAVLPYLDLLDELSIYDLWTACNENGLFALRRAHLDSRCPSTMRGSDYLDKTRAAQALDGFLGNRRWMIDHWLDEYLKSGASLDDIMNVVGSWLDTKSDVESLQLASAAVLHIGERRHLALLRAAKIEPVDVAAAIVADVEFGVSRRTLRV